ncbi:hypothetical protein J27TS8_04950 [Robertmurraya siralis]|uniref:Uncharacterized protein n=1 Tax=Robertmurraya siralis TaxID=77777 RepID=A0A920BSS0_9BACI|nr:hypothetical protein [Robertmurraya siralis]GIN60502.1 hypothetical protein J27TS8_04950 [Robertmurraya siralis]
MKAKLLGDVKIYTEKQWKSTEKYYLKKLKNETEKTERAQEAVRNLTKQLVNKNQEIEKLTFFVEMLSTALEASCKAIEALKEQKAN